MYTFIKYILYNISLYCILQLRNVENRHTKQRCAKTFIITFKNIIIKKDELQADTVYNVCETYNVYTYCLCYWPAQSIVKAESHAHCSPSNRQAKQGLPQSININALAPARTPRPPMTQHNAINLHTFTMLIMKSLFNFKRNTVFKATGLHTQWVGLISVTASSYDKNYIHVESGV